MAHQIYTELFEPIEKAKVALAFGDDDTAFLEGQDFEFAAKDALDKLFNDRPLVNQVETEGESRSRLPLPLDFTDQSIVRRVEYPTGFSPPQYLGINEWQLIRMSKQITIANVSSGTTITAATPGDAVFFKANMVVRVQDEKDQPLLNHQDNWVAVDGDTGTGVITLKNTITGTFNTKPVVRKIDHVLLTSITPQANQFTQIDYTAKYLITDIHPGIDRPFINLISHYIASFVAARFAKKGSNSLQAAISDQSSKHDLWVQIAKSKLDLYKQQLNIGQDRTKRPAMKRVVLESSPDWPGSRWLTHKRGS